VEEFMNDLNQMILLVCGWLVVFAIAGYFWRRRKMKLTVLLAAPPDKCPKCGHYKAKKNTMGMNTPTWHSPNHRERSVLFAQVEHLSYSCWECGYDVKTKPEIAA